MRWPRLVASLVLVGGLVLSPGRAAGQAECTDADVPSIGTIALAGRETGRIEGDRGGDIPIVGYEFSVERDLDGRVGVGAAQYAPLVVRKPVDAATDAVAAMVDSEEDLSRVVLIVHGPAGRPLFSYRFGIGKVASQDTSTEGPCEVEEIRFAVGIVHITHEPSGESVVDSGHLDNS